MSEMQDSSCLYWEHLWNTVRDQGWHLTHYSYTDRCTGSARHVLVARKASNELVCSARTVQTAMLLIFREIQNTIRGHPGRAG